jgi:hypothetical protein
MSGGGPIPLAHAVAAALLPVPSESKMIFFVTGFLETSFVPYPMIRSLDAVSELTLAAGPNNTPAVKPNNMTLQTPGADHGRLPAAGQRVSGPVKPRFPRWLSVVSFHPPRPNHNFRFLAPPVQGTMPRCFAAIV